MTNELKNIACSKIILQTNFDLQLDVAPFSGNVAT